MSASHSKVDPFRCGMNVASIRCGLISGSFAYCLMMFLSVVVWRRSVHSG